MFEFQLKAKMLVANYFNETSDRRYERRILTVDQIRVVWFSETLQNWKAVLVTSLPDGILYEVTHDGERGVCFVEIYQLKDQFEVHD